MALPYDGRDLDHPEHGKAIKVYDFTNIKAENKWIVEYKNGDICIYRPEHKEPSKYLSCINDFPFLLDAWKNFIKDHNCKPIILKPLSQPLPPLGDRWSDLIR